MNAALATEQPSADVNPEVTSPAEGHAASRSARKPHGKGFVYLGLRDAEEAIQKIDHHAKRMSKEGFARALGHQKAEGRFPNKLEALKLYKLVQEDGDDVVLTNLGVDMVYGGSESTRTKARATAFLSYEPFAKTFSECPKGQDHPLSYLVDYVKAKLGIVNEVDRFKRLFLESAHFAGLLEGEADPHAKTIRMRHALALPANGDAPVAGGGERKPQHTEEMVAGQAFQDALANLGLSAYAERAEVTSRAAGKVKVSFEDGNVTFEVNRPLKVKITDADLILDLPEMAKALRAKGFDV